MGFFYLSMQWLIQCTDLPDTNTIQILDAIKQLNKPYVGIGVIPFTHEVRGLEGVDPNKPSLFYCSVQLAQMVSTWTTYRPGVVYDNTMYDPRKWKRSDLLNCSPIEITVEKLRKEWVKEPTFIKSVSDKVLTGMVIEPEKEDRDNWLIEQSQLDKDELLLFSPALNIETECRFFIIDNQIITGSTYRWLGCRTIRRPIDSEMLDYANEVVKGWLPAPVIVVDLCRLKNGDYRVVEFNCVNCSGFYNSDVCKIVQALEEYYA